MKHSIVGIVGHKRHGKDSVADVFIANGYKRYAMADPLKRAVQEIFMFTDEQLYGNEEKEKIDERWGVSPRKTLQVVGTDLFRDALKKAVPEMDFGDDGSLWCRRFHLWLDAQMEAQKIILSDVRFEDEAKTITDLGGMLIRVIRPIENEEKDMHPSETEQDKIVADFTIQNDGTLEKLKSKTCNLFSAVFEAHKFEEQQVNSKTQKFLSEEEKFETEIYEIMDNIETSVKVDVNEEQESQKHVINDVAPNQLKVDTDVYVPNKWGYKVFSDGSMIAHKKTPKEIEDEIESEKKRREEWENGREEREKQNKEWRELQDKREKERQEKRKQAMKKMEHGKLVAFSLDMITKLENEGLYYSDDDLEIFGDSF